MWPVSAWLLWNKLWKVTMINELACFDELMYMRWCLNGCVSRCSSGFYGNPQVKGGSCLPCECNGNININETGSCDSFTGDCLHCLSNTAGKHCELCQPGYYGDAVHAKDCKGEYLTFSIYVLNTVGSDWHTRIKPSWIKQQFNACLMIAWSNLQHFSLNGLYK